MKKTTTRLASIAAVLTMSAFAIVLAQHDARKRDRHEEPLVLANSSSEPSAPLESDLVWPGKNPIVRAKNGQPAKQLERYEAYSVEQAELPGGYAAVSNALRDEPVDAAMQPSMNVDNTVADRPEASDVVAASGVQTALPAWLPDGASAPALPVSTLPAPPTLSIPQPVAGQSAQNPAIPRSWNSSPNMGSAQFEQPSKLPSTSGTEGLPGTIQSPSALPDPAGLASSFSSTAPSNPPTSGPGLLPMPAVPSANAQEGPSFPRGVPSPAAMQPGTMQPGTFASISSSTDSMGSLANTAGSMSASRPLDAVARTALVSNQPGSRFLDGSQNPIMLIQKRAPEEIQVGKKATFVITVRNAGNATAHEVTVVDRVPQGSRFADSSPAITPTADGVISWMLGEMAAGDERTISLQIVPEVEGEVGSVASVHFAAQASVRTVATLPQLVLQVESLGPVVIGQAQQVVVSLQNTGSGVARGVRLEADIPSQFRHESGETQLEAFVGDLRPSESRRLTLGVAAVQPGQSQCVLRAVNEDGVQAERALDIDVRAPQLTATVSGPSLRYLERQANYQVVVSNSGTAIARNLDFVVHLPVGLKYISADIPQANYNPQTHSISLGLAELDSGQSAPFTITVLPVQLGAQVIRFNGTGDLGLTAEAKAQVTVAGLAELSFTIGQDNGTVEVGANTTYAVQVSNIGNQPDKNVQLSVQLPEGTKLLQVDAPVEYRVEGDRIVFSPVAEMRNRDMMTFRFQIQHNRAGNQVVRSQLTSENWPVAVVKEEGTLVYNDQN